MQTMLIEHTKSHYWLKPVGDNILDPFSKSSREKLKSTLKRYTEYSISHTILPISEEALAWFTPFYTEIVSGKNNPELHDIKAGTNKEGAQYFILIVNQGDKKVGATIFSVQDWYLSIAFRAYQNNWDGIALRSNPSLLAEYFLAEHAQNLNIKFISHGKDRNPYGPNSHIGLAAYKLSVGCKVFINSRGDEVHQFDTSEVTTDTLVLHRPDKIRISKATLFTTEDNVSKYAHVTKYPDLLDVEIVTI